MVTSVQLYEALKDRVGEEAARMLADAIPVAGEIATKSDIAQLRADIKGVEANLMRWMLTFFVPLWLGVYGTIIALVLKG